MCKTEKTIVISLVVMVFVIGMLATYTIVDTYRTSARYEQGVQQMLDGDLDAAVNTFESLRGYLDARHLSSQTRYRQGIYALADGVYSIR